MKFRTEIIIDASREQVWSVFDNPDNMTRWQNTLKSFTHKSGEPGQPGAISELHYEENGRNIMMTEVITERREPDFLAGTYQTDWADSTVVNHFEAVDENTTCWVGYCNFNFKGFMKILGFFMGGSIRKRTCADMERFKLLVETEFARS